MRSLKCFFRISTVSWEDMLSFWDRHCVLQQNQSVRVQTNTQGLIYSNIAQGFLPHTGEKLAQIHLYFILTSKNITCSGNDFGIFWYSCLHYVLDFENGVNALWWNSVPEALPLLPAAVVYDHREWWRRFWITLTQSPQATVNVNILNVQQIFL